MISDIGENLRRLRRQEGLSLRELSRSTGLSATLLSQLERGLAEPSLRSLRALSTAFGTDASTLFAGSIPGDVRTHVSRPGQRPRISSPIGHIQYERVTPNNGQVEVLKGHLNPGDWSSDEPWSHEAVECAYVEEGTLTVEIESEEFILGSGESVTFSSNRAHRYGNLSSAPVTFLLSVSPPTP